MGPLPSWIALASASTAAVLVLILAALTLSRRSWRGAALQGLRGGFRRPAEGLVRSVPTALVVSVVLASLSVGDSLFSMVGANTDANLSSVDAAIIAQGYIDPAFMESASTSIGDDLISWAPVIEIASTGRAERTPGRFDVRTIALDDRALLLAGIKGFDGKVIHKLPDPSGCYINEMLSKRSGALAGDWVSVEVPLGGLSEKSLLGMGRERSIRMNLTVREVVQNTGWGRYREDARPEAPPVLVANLSRVSFGLGEPGKANKLLLDLREGTDPERLRGYLDDVIGIGAAGFTVGHAERSGGKMLWGKNVFFTPFEGLRAIDGGIETLSYFVDGISSKSGDAPYSVVSALDDSDLSHAGLTALEGNLQALGEDGIAITPWLRDELGLSLGESVSLDFRELSDLGTLVHGNRSFTLKAVLTPSGMGVEPALMPPIPGITEMETCADWDPSFDIDTGRLTGPDLQYWEENRTAPKAFVSLKTAREMWSVPYGNTTAVWFPGAGPDIEEDLDDAVGAKEAGLSIMDLRERALSSSRGLLIFPPMFLTFGTPIVAAAFMVLFSLERDLFQRRLEELSTLRALGVTRRTTATIFIWGSIPSLLIGGALGALLGSLLGRFLSYGLSSIWSRTVEGVPVPFSVSSGSIITAVSAGCALSLAVTILISFHNSGRVPMKNMRGEDPTLSGPRKKALWTAASAVTLAVGAGMALAGPSGQSVLPEELLFIASNAMIASGVASLLVLVLPVVGRSVSGLLVTSEVSRRPGRYPLAAAVVALTLALVLSMTAVSGMLLGNEDDLSEGYGGGFDHVVELSVPFSGDLNGTLRSAGPSLTGIPVLSLGSEGGTCTNVNAPFPPRLLALGGDVSDRKGFKLLEREKGPGSDEGAWSMLQTLHDGRVPILVDQNTLVWIYGKGLGDTFELDMEGGGGVELVVIGVLSPSVLTGTFVMSWGHLLDLYPSLASVTMVLVRGQEGSRESEERDAIERAFSAYSPKVTPTSELAMRNLEGELSYLGLFRDLLALGLFTSLVSSIAFIHSRAISLSRELEVLRAVGLGRRKALSYLSSVNMSVMLAAGIGSLAGAFLSILAFSEAIGGELSAATLLTPVPLTASFLAVSAIISIASASLSTRGYSGYAPRN